LSKIALSGNASGTGTFTLASPNSNTDRTLNLPDAAGTIQVSGNPISGTTGTFTGLVDISAAGAGQIAFPATQNASANANTLDDYEEGTWTPTDASGAALSFTNTSGNCFYTKIGRIVIASFRVTYPSTADGSSARIGGFPFAAGLTTNNSQAVSFSEQNYLAGVMGIMSSNATNLAFITTSSGSVTVRTNADISGKDFRGTAVYFV
jgi:hypothetical protein